MCFPPAFAPQINCLFMYVRNRSQMQKRSHVERMMQRRASPMQSRAREKWMMRRGHPTEQILPAYGRTWLSRFHPELWNCSRVQRQRKELVRLRFVNMPKPWTRSKQHSLVVYARVVGAQPRRRLPVWLAHAVSRSRFTSSPICGTHVEMSHRAVDLMTIFPKII